MFVLMFAAMAMLAVTASSVKVRAQGCTPTWAAGGLMPDTNVRSFGVYFPANGKFYAIGGRATDTAGSDAINPYEYNPATNTWTTKAALLPDNQVNNMACGLLTVSGTPLIYCVGGSEAGGVPPRAVRVFSYNPVTDTIAVLPAADNWPGGSNNLPGGAAVLNNKLYTIGGFTGSAMIAGVWAFDPNAASGSRWQARQDLPAQRGYVPAVGLGGFVYAMGGSAWNGTTLQDSTECFKYDPAANTWTPIASLPRATGETRAVVINNQVWVLGGGRTPPKNPSKEVDIYDPATNSWGLGPPFMLERRNFAADSDSGVRIFLGGGYGGNPSATFEDTTEYFVGCAAGPSPTPTPTPTISPGITPTPIPTRTPTPTPTPPPTPSPTPPFDFDGDHKTDISIWRASAGQWWLYRSTAGIIGMSFGESNAIPRAADYTGDRKTDVAFYRPFTSEWFILRSENFTYYSFPFGSAGDIPVPGDYDGDGRADASVYRPSLQLWFILRSSGGLSIIPFGLSDDIKVPADYDGDGKTDVAIYRPSVGQWWYIRSRDGEVAAFTFGTSTDKPVPGDYTGDGKADIAFWRPSTGEWFILRSENLTYYAFPWGTNGDRPAPGDYDGDGRFDAAVFRPSDGTWYILRSSSGISIVPFGVSGDIPVPGQSIP